MAKSKRKVASLSLLEIIRQGETKMLQLEKATSQNNAIPQVAMFQMITGYWISKSIYAAAKLGIADLLKDGSQSCEQIAATIGTNARSIHRLLRALACIGIFVEEKPGYFALTPLAACLQTEFPGSMRSVAIALVEEQFQAWGDFLYSIQTGKTAFEHVYGMPIFQYYMEHPEQFKIFDAAMSQTHGIKDRAVLASYDFSGIRQLVDVGGGKGGLITTILKAYPTLEGVLFDLPRVIAEQAHESALSDRLQQVSGDFFASVFAGGDAYILKRILHDWNDEQSLTILKNCRQAIAENGKLLLVESVIPSGNEPCTAKFLDLHMLAVTGGMERTETEYSDLLAAAGFKLMRIIPTPADIDVIEAIPV